MKNNEKKKKPLLEGSEIMDSMCFVTTDYCVAAPVPHSRSLSCVFLWLLCALLFEHVSLCLCLAPFPALSANWHVELLIRCTALP
jgi:hypothetical protein